MMVFLNGDDGFFVIPDDLKTLHLRTKLALEVLKLKCSNLMLPCRGSSFDLASRLYYFYHPSLALQSNERPIINFNSVSTSPSLNNVIAMEHTCDFCTVQYRLLLWETIPWLMIYGLQPPSNCF